MISILILPPEKRGGVWRVPMFVQLLVGPGKLCGVAADFLPSHACTLLCEAVDWYLYLSCLPYCLLCALGSLEKNL